MPDCGPRPKPSDLDQLTDDAQGNLLGCDRPDRKTDGRVDPLEQLLGSTLLAEFLQDRQRLSPAADHPDVLCGPS